MDLTKFGFSVSGSKTTKRKSSEEKCQKKKEYEKKRVRTFQDSWLKEFSGLATDKDGSMFCQICRSHKITADKACSMFVGTSAFRKDTLISHWKSQAHVRSMEREALELKAKSKYDKKSENVSGDKLELVGPIVDCARKMDAAVEEQIKKLINTAYFVCKEEMPFTNYTTLISLQEKNGLDVGGFYQTDNASRRFVKHIYDEIYQKNLEELFEKKFFSILIDGATDSSVTENELIYVRFVVDGKPENHYPSVEDMKNANATGILETIETAFERANFDDWKNKLVGFGSDGASVNLGVRGGVAALIKNDVAHLVSVHCVAHRLELAANNAIKGHKVMNDIQDMLHHIYHQYHYSPKALSELREIANALEEKVLKPSNLHGTRWLPHIHQALQILVRNISTIMTHFEHILGGRTGTAEVQGRASNVSKKLKEYSFLYMVFFMLDVLKVLSTFSLQVQKDNITLSQLFDVITTAHFSLVELKNTNGEELNKFIHDVQNDTYRTIVLKNVQQNESFLRQRQEIIDLLVNALDKRFGPMEKDPVLKAALLILDLGDYPNNRDDLAAYANEELNLLMQHFHAILENAGCDIQLVADEFKEFKSHVFRHRTMPIEHYFTIENMRQRFLNFLLLIEVLLVFPLSSAACERGFSAMKRIKSDWRSSLSPSMLRMLMHIVIEGPTLQHFNSVPVIDRWWRSGRAMRPGFNPFDFRQAMGRDDSEESD